MKKNITIIFAIILFAACSNKKVIRGEGQTITQNRTQNINKEFKNVKINGSTNAVIKYGSQLNLEVKGYSNLLPILNTDVVGNTLLVEFKDNHNVINDNTEIVLTLPYLPSLQLNGNIETTLTGVFPAQQSVFFAINGFCKINATGAETNLDYAKYTISGNGEILAYNIISKSFEGNISGNGEMKISVFNALNANISGNGKIYYKGNPIIKENISGVGKVVNSN